MEEVPFERVERIKRELPDELLPGLVAVFSKAHRDALLLVYLTKPQETRPPRWQAITLAELPDMNLAEFDGPMLGLAAVDLIRPDIPTKGPQFMRLDRFLRRRGLFALLYQTWADLATHLSEMQPGNRFAGTGPESSHRLRAAIAAIAAPQKIANLPIELRRGMVAFVPARNRAICLDDLSLDSLAKIAVGPDEKVVALEEVRPWLEAAHPHDRRDRHAIDLRTILHRAHLTTNSDEALHNDTLRRLALAFHRRWRGSRDSRDCERAYALALELHTARGDVDDLVAVIPDANFETFVHTGAGTYVYRRPLEGHRRSPAGIERRYLDDALPELARPGVPAVFALLPLRDLIGSESTRVGYWFDLGPPLCKGGRTEIVARNAWLLAQDFLAAPRERRVLFVATLDSLHQTLVRCCAIFSLTDPWRIRQGRRNEWLQEAYATLRRALEMLSQRSETPQLSAYYTALAYWYGCATVPDNAGVLASLELMVSALTSRVGGVSRGELAETTLAQSQQLRSVGEALLEVLRGGGRAEAYRDLLQSENASISLVVRHATDMARPIDLLSTPFRNGFQRFADISDSVRRIRAAQVPVRDKIERLTSCLDQLVKGRRLIFAPYHQTRILDALYTSAIDELRDLVTRLRGGAVLELELRTPSISADSDDSGIVLAVTNVGSVAAVDVEVELAASDAFELLDQSFKQTLGRLGPEGEHQFRFSLRRLGNDDALPVRCMVSCSDTNRRRQQGVVEFVLRVTGSERGPFRPKPNPYIFGLPLQEHRQFYGRRDELEQLLGHLAIRRPQNILLRGARRTGKTSLLYMVRAVLADTGGRSGTRDWFELPPAWHEALDATTPVPLDLQAIEWPHGTPTATGFYHAVLAALHTAGLRSDYSDLLIDEPSVTFTQFVKALRDIVHGAGERRPVILVDEFDVLDRIADKSSFYGPMRSAISSIQGVTWIVASALGLYKEVRDYESPLFNIFKIINLGLLEREAARRLVLRPWEHDPGRRDWSPLRFADDAVESILEEAGRYPYFIQLLCSEIVDHINATETNFVQFRTVLQVIDRRILTDGSAASEHFAYLWERASGLGKLILLTLLHHPGAMDHDELKDALVRRLPMPAVSPSATRAMAGFEDSLQRLVSMDAIRRVPGSGFAYGIPLFRRLLLSRDEQEDLDQAAYAELSDDSPAAADRD